MEETTGAPSSCAVCFINDTINLGSFSTGITDIDLVLNETMSSTQGFGYTYAFAAAGFSSGVPEPSTWAMMLIGFAGIGFMTYRQTKRNTTALGTA
jgi:hypothetical protein